MLTYLFKATFDDGSVYQQTPEDQSLVDPQKSAFYDVLCPPEGKKLVEFSIHHADGSFYSVNFQNGIINLNNKGKIDPPEGLSNFRIIYFRRNVVNSVGSVIVEHWISYFIGWQANDSSGKNHQQTIEIYG